MEREEWHIGTTLSEIALFLVLPAWRMVIAVSTGVRGHQSALLKKEAASTASLDLPDKFHAEKPYQRGRLTPLWPDWPPGGGMYVC